MCFHDLMIQFSSHLVMKEIGIFFFRKKEKRKEEKEKKKESKNFFSFLYIKSF